MNDSQHEIPARRLARDSTIRLLLTFLLVTGCVKGENGPVIESPTTARSDSQLSDTALVYLGELPNPDTITVPVVSESQMESGVVYWGGRRMNFGAFDSLAPRLSLPRVTRTGCDETGCEHARPAVACRELVLHATDSDHAAVLGRIASGDSLTIMTANLHIVAPGKVFFRNNYAITEKYHGDGASQHEPRPDTVRFAAGDTLYVFEQHEEGFVTWWYRGMLGHGVPFWDTLEAVEISPQRTVFWYKTTKSDGMTGWWKGRGTEVAGVGRGCDVRKGEAT